MTHDSLRPDLVFVHPSDEFYGSDRMLLEMVDALDPGERVEVWVPTDLSHPDAPLCRRLEARGVTVRHMDLPILRRAYRTVGGLTRLTVREALLIRELRRLRPRAVYCTTSAAFLAAPAARLARVPHVLGHVQEIWSAGDRRLLTPLASACNELVAISEPAAASLSERLLARTSVVPNATPDPGQGRSLTGRSGPLTFVVASRWNSWKGHRTLLAAWDRLEAPPGRLVVLGGPPPVGEAVDVTALVTRMRHRDSVEVVGEVPDAAPYLDEADVAVVPSDDPEPFGLVTIEAFAHARPVIGSAGGGLADIVTPDLDGWLFPPRDVAALAAVLERLERDTVAEAGRQARRTYESRFTPELFRHRWNAVVTSSAGDR